MDLNIHIHSSVLHSSMHCKRRTREVMLPHREREGLFSGIEVTGSRIENREEYTETRGAALNPRKYVT